MKKVIIMRGIPGSGKTHHSWKLIQDAGFHPCQPEYAHVSADRYFERDGEYKFDPKLIGEAHKTCMQMFLDATEYGCELIVVDNTNTQVWEYTPYFQVAQAKGYEVEIVEVVADLDVCLARQQHGVPAEHLERMQNRFQRVLPHHRPLVTKIVNNNK